VRGRRRPHGVVRDAVDVVTGGRRRSGAARRVSDYARDLDADVTITARRAERHWRCPRLTPIAANDALAVDPRGPRCAGRAPLTS
jgi:hypothetical protein